ncbi:uncharacterized protein LOC127799162 [Diospyros lotus]|uniref:uncharacterized protein LOC127799162 n=1 Tax=Diospyros lotus TaxID=55363 RepID=UPI0022580B24|nr:uncharacterized protein LOC127799162 [Diospyros lotus]
MIVDIRGIATLVIENSEEANPPALGRSPIGTRDGAGPSRCGEYGKLGSEEEESSSPDYARAGGAQRERRLRHLEMEVAELRRREEEPHDIVSNQPLSREIMAITPSERLRIPAIKPYGGTTDPADHLNLFTSHMMVQAAPDAMWCRVFPATLEGHARSWYSSLAHRSIANFGQLRNRFLAHFAPLRRHQRSTMTLVNLKQNQGESLTDFVARFNMEALSIENLDQSIAMVAFQNALRVGPFTQSLAKRPPQTFTEILSQATKYINAEEVMRVKRSEYSDKKEKRSQNQEQKPEDKSGRRGERSGPRWSPVRFTLLNTPRAEILATIENKDYLKKSRPMKAPANKQSKDKYCQFHRDHGHDTEECHQLKEEIQELINRGFLRRFVAKDTEPQRGERRGSRSPPRRCGRSQERRRTRTPPRRENRHGDGSPPQQLIFHTLAAGVVPGKESRETSDLHRRPGVKRARPGDVISFTDDDLPGYPISNDPLVITAKLGKWELRRILVDPGSSSEVLYRQAFLGMGYEMEQLKPARVPLIGFDGEVVYADGVFQLLLTLGKGSRFAQVMLDILVANVPSAYNMILGRSGLNALRAVPSTYHMVLKFPTAARVGEVRGDLRSARECYMASISTVKGVVQEQLEPQEDSRRRRSPTVGEVGISPPATISFLLEGPEDPKTAEPVDELVEVPLDPNRVDRCVRVSAQLKDPIRTRIVSLLRQYADIFAWSVHDIPGIDPAVMTHRLGVK